MTSKPPCHADLPRRRIGRGRRPLGPWPFNDWERSVAERIRRARKGDKTAIKLLEIELRSLESVPSLAFESHRRALKRIRHALRREIPPGAKRGPKHLPLPLIRFVLEMMQKLGSKHRPFPECIRVLSTPDLAGGSVTRRRWKKYEARPQAKDPELPCRGHSVVDASEILSEFLKRFQHTPALSPARIRELVKRRRRYLARASFKVSGARVVHEGGGLLLVERAADPRGVFRSKARQRARKSTKL